MRKTFPTTIRRISPTQSARAQLIERLHNSNSPEEIKELRNKLIYSNPQPHITYLFEQGN